MGCSIETLLTTNSDSYTAKLASCEALGLPVYSALIHTYLVDGRLSSYGVIVSALPPAATDATAEVAPQNENETAK